MQAYEGYHREALHQTVVPGLCYGWVMVCVSHTGDTILIGFCRYMGEISYWAADQWGSLCIGYARSTVRMH
jgi:hypothetical protein